MGAAPDLQEKSKRDVGAHLTDERNQPIEIIDSDQGELGEVERTTPGCRARHLEFHPVDQWRDLCN